MNIEKLLYYTTDVEEGTREVRDGIMLTLKDPSGRTNLHIPIESVSIVEENGEQLVVINLIMSEDAIWFKYDGFNEDIKVWRCGTPPADR